MRKSIAVKIIISYSLLILLLVTVISVFFDDLFRETSLDVIRREMREKLNFIELVIGQQPEQSLRGDRLRVTLDSISRIIALRITVVNFVGVVIADTEVKDLSSLENHRYRAEIKQAMAGGHGTTIRLSHTMGKEMMYSAKRSNHFIIRLAKPLDEINESITMMRKIIAAGGLVMFIGAFGIIVLLSKRIARPIAETIIFAREFADGNYSRRFLNYSEDEVGELQRSLNRMADSLSEKIANLVFEQNKLAATLGSISDGIAVVGNDKKIMIANAAFNEFFDYPQSPAGKLFFEVIRSRRLNARIEEAIKKGNNLRFEETMVTGNIYSIHVRPLKDETTLQGILVVLQDVTEKKRIEEIKTDLVGNMSHELKTPITIIKGYLETIQDNLDNGELCQSYIRKALENADRQSSLINDILLLHELETSGDFVMEPIDIREIIAGCAELLRAKAADKGVRIDLPEHTHNAALEKVKGNKFLAEEIFFNIIDNAISYNNPSGSVIIAAESREDGIFVSVRDTGIGIPPSAIDRIFERFYRVDKSRSRATGGTGLGLSIVKHAAELMNWEITVSSDRSGSVFTVKVG